MAWNEGWDDEPTDDYDKPRDTDWDTLAEARAAATASPACGDGAVLIYWERTLPDGTQVTRYSWRGSDKGMDMPTGAKVAQTQRGGIWQAN